VVEGGLEGQDGELIGGHGGSGEGATKVGQVSQMGVKPGRASLFASACETVKKFMRSAVISRLSMADECSAAIGTFVVVNKDGWCLTANHILKMCEAINVSRQATLEHERKVEEIRKDASLDAKERSKRLSRLGKPKPEATKRFSPWWGRDGCRAVDAKGLDQADLGLFRLDPWKPEWASAYPKFIDPDKSLRIGTSLCRMGYPFAHVKPTYLADRDIFELPAGSVSLPPFPIEGILTRHISLGASSAGYIVGFVETSSPGLKGQSGGPIFDREGTVWGIQSQTSHLYLGFDPEVPNGRPGEKEHQFLNVGWGVHPQTVAGFLRENGIAFDIA